MYLVDSGFKGGVEVTPSDTVNISFPTGTPYSRAIYVGVSGDINALLSDGTTILFKAAPVGVLPVGVKRINSTSTTATNLVALY